ncbi:MAG TPA: hypothetical protein VJ983_08465 [candidate division Zixibacteria bacterium]|nr:hypothetical protein [candidate division Zixibacteria bacterium]
MSGHSVTSTWQCADLNGDGDAANVVDMIIMVDFMFHDGPSPFPETIADCDGNGTVDISDLVRMVDYLFGTGDPPVCSFPGLPDHEEIPGECLSGSYDAQRTDSVEYMYAEAIGSDIHIHHMNAFYNCCLGYRVDHEFVGNHITATEHDTLDACDCYCLFNLETVLYDVPLGEYIVTLIGGANARDTIGIDTVVTIPHITRFEWDGCFPQEEIDDTAEFIYTYHDDTLSLDNVNVWFLCLARFEVRFKRVGNILCFYEINVDTSAPACICLYNIHSQAASIPPGEYTVEVYKQELLWGDRLELLDRRTLVPEN